MHHHQRWRHALRHRFGRDPGPFTHHHRRGGGRFFEQGDLRWVMLALIAEAPRHGYEIIKAIEERLGGAYAPSPGVVYPTLTFLEDMGYVASSQAGGGKKTYAITPDGEKALADRKPEVDSLYAFMAEMRARHARPAPEIHRAWENLRTALNLKVAREPMTPEQVRAVTAALDAAAAAIERS